MKKLPLLLLFTLGSSILALKAQDRHIIDSLKNEIKKYEARKLEMGSKATPLMDSVKANLLYKLSKEYWTNTFDTGIKYATQSLSASSHIGYKTGTGNAYSSLGIIYHAKGLYVQSFDNEQKAIQIYQEIGDKKGIANTYNRIGHVDYDRGNYVESLKNYFAALHINQEIKDSAGMAYSYGRIGLLYNIRGDFPEALNNTNEALKIESAMRDKDAMAVSYNYLGISYFQMGNYSDGLSNGFKALMLAQEVNDQNRIAWSSFVIGDIYYAQTNYSEALKYYQTSLKIVETLNQLGDIAYASIRIGAIYQKQNLLWQALEYELNGLKLAKEGGNKGYMKDAYENIASIYAKLGRYQEAYTNEVLYKQYYDSVYNVESGKKLAGLQMQYEFNRKEDSLKTAEIKHADSLKVVQAKKDAIAKKEIQNQRNILWFLLGGLVLVLVFTGFVFRSLRLSRIQRIEIEKEKQRAEQSEKFKEQFLANMSHEIRTPMNAVNGMTEILLEKKPLPEQVKYLEAIRKSSDTLLHFINDILDLSKIEAGKMEMEKIDFSLQDTIEQVKQTLSFRAEEKGLQLITQIDDSTPDVVVGDPVRLNQILVNLGGNAIKFTEKGSVHIAVKQLKIPTPFGFDIQFTVTDTGIGIPKEKLQQVFESFTQANTSDNRKFGGTGLGLSISKQLVELQGGKISVESEEGTGTTFSFTLNYRAGSKEKLEQRLNSGYKIDGSALKGMRILIADDNEYNRIVAKDTLQLKAFVQIDEAENGEQVLQQLEKHRYDVILMDVQMPVMDGYEATRKIRNSFPSPKNTTPIIALTASVIRTDLEKCKQAGMNNYVPKPYKAWQLFNAIAEATGRMKGHEIVNSAEPRDGNEKQVMNNDLPSETPAVTDLAYLNQFCEGDEVKIKKYIVMYLKAIPLFTEKIEEALKTENQAEISSQVHALKSKMLMMGMVNTRDIAQQIELQCKEEIAFTNIHENLDKLLEQLSVSVVELGNSKYS